MRDEKSSFPSMAFVVEHDSLTMEISPAALKRCLATPGNTENLISSPSGSWVKGLLKISEKGTTKFVLGQDSK